MDPCDTVPVTPEPSYEDEQNAQAFAHLTPISRAARLAFDSAVDAIKSDPDYFAHLRRNMHVEPNRQVSPSTASVFTDSDTTETEASSNEVIYRYKGAFHFKLGNPPRDPKKGWILGDGRNSAARQVDFLLSGPKKTAEIAGIHATIFIHERSCRLVLGARHKMTVHASNGTGTSTTLSRTSCPAQLAREDEIRIGECVYLFEYDEDADRKEHEQQLVSFMKKTHGPTWEGILKILGSSPEAVSMRLNEYSWSLGAFAHGSFGQVTAGTRRDGSAVAVKRFWKPKEDFLSSHRRMMSYIGKHSHIVELLDCYAGPDAKVPEAYCIYQPLASGTLHDLASQQKLAVATQVTLFRQYLDGLSFLHEEKGVMHRDIKPNNLGIVGLVSPKAVIFDLDCATCEATSFDHSQGCLSYLAPEIVALKAWTRDKEPLPPPYGRKVDVWALGVSAYVSATGVRLKDECMTDKLYRLIQQHLQGRIEEDGVEAPFLKNVLRMLAWSAHKRPSAAEALEAFRRIDGAHSQDAGTSTRTSRSKRQREVGSPPGRRAGLRR